MLPGFLVSHVMVGELKKARPGVAYGTFIFRRFARIYPALLICVIIEQMAVSVLRGYNMFSACDQMYAPLPGIYHFIWVRGLANPVLKYALAVGNYYPYNTCQFTEAPWTVSFEFQCYLIFPFIIMLHNTRAWAVALLMTLVIFVISIATRPYQAAHTTLYLLCEFSMGVIAYFAVGSRGLDWLNPSPHSQVRPFDGPLLYGMQLLWYLTTGLFVFNVFGDGFSSQGSDYQRKHDVFARPILATSTAMLIICSCGFACDVSAPDVESVAGSAGLRRAREAWVSMPLSSLLSALSVGWLFPIASISYTGYLLQGISMNLAVYTLRLTTNTVAGQWDGTVDGLTALGVDLILFACVVLADSALGLLASLTIERPMMNLLYLLQKAYGSSNSAT